MAELEKVIEALKRCYPFGTCEKEECPYYHDMVCLETLHDDALSLLELQVPRTLTLDEIYFDCPDYVYFETKTGWIECCTKDEGESSERFAYFVYGVNEWFEREYESYGKTWRCWTTNPSDDQRKAAKWDG